MTNNPNVLLTTKQAADYLGLENHSTLYAWKFHKRYHLPYVKIGSKVMYRQSDLDAFIEANLNNPEPTSNLYS